VEPVGIEPTPLVLQASAMTSSAIVPKKAGFLFLFRNKESGKTEFRAPTWNRTKLSCLQDTHITSNVLGAN